MSFSENQLKSAFINKENIMIDDSLIMDPRILKMVNQYREVQIGNDIFKITDLGVFRCTEGSILNLRSLIKNKDFRKSIHSIVDGLIVTKRDENINRYLKSASLINYNEYNVGDNVTYMVDPDDIIIDEPNNYVLATSIMNEDPLFQSSTDSSPYLVQTPTSTPTALMNLYDESSKTWVGEQLAGILGYSVEGHNYFRSDVRVKTVFWSQNYIFTESTGVKVKMQNRALGIWWAEKAEELKLGWESVSISSEYQPNPISINISYNNKIYTQSTDLHQALFDTQFQAWRADNWPEWKQPFVQLLWFMADVPEGVNNFIYKKSISWLRDYAKNKIKALNGPINDNLAVTFVQPQAITTVFLPRDPIIQVFNDNKTEFYFEKHNAEWAIGYNFTGGSPSSPIGYLKEFPYNFTLQKGSKVFGIAKWNGTYRGSYILKTQ